ncbi:hypothetical protein BRD00_08045 [Halobacteriales archaeon QS_8_69_26]|nr:MAG: hypothetical protein BRD00_08045 [Halobacteriales archaeon QS_8_69_26]
MVQPSTAFSAAMLVALLASSVVIYRLDRPGGRWGQRLRERFVMGVPWGTLVTTLFVLGSYLFVQGGYWHWYDPVTVAFRAWSFSYPLGMVTAPFTHQGPDHLIGNLVGTVTLATVAEYAWGHYPTERGTTSFSSPLTNPWARALLVFPGAVVVAGFLGSVLTIGPVIGFSLVVFAFAGFALARYPLGTVVAVVAAGAVRTVYFSLLEPVRTVQPSPSPPSPPWWAEIAIQGHAIGLFLGVILGAVLFSRRDEAPPALHVWTGVGLFAMTRAMWAVYWFRGSNTYVLYRGLGVVLVATLALLVAAGLTASDRPVLHSLRGLVPTRGERRVEADGGRAPDDSDPPTPADDGTVDAPDEDDGLLGGRVSLGGGSILGGGSGDRRMRDMTWRHVSLLVLVLGFALLGGPGVGSNLFTAGGEAPQGESVAVGDYRVTYAEGVTDEMVAIVDVEFLNETTVVETSGVIVSSERRGIWYQSVSKGELAFSGERTVRVGGVGWRRSVTAIRRGWSAAGGGTAYKVWLEPDGGERRFAFNSSPATADPVVANRNVSVVAPPEGDGFYLRVTRNDTALGSARIPASGEEADVAGLRFVNRDGDVYVHANGTRVQVASKEEYE